jgi:hypothetical protein
MLVLTVMSLCLGVLSGEDETKKGNDASSPAGTKTSSKKKTVVIHYNPADKDTVKVIPLDTVSYATVDEICRPMLTKKGALSYLRDRNAVLVLDKKSVVDKIAMIIKKIDLPAVNIRVDVDFVGSGNSRHDRLNVAFYNHKTPHKKNQFTIVNGKMVPIDTVEISGVKGSGSSVNNTSQFIMTMSGHPARLWVGKRIIDPTWLAQVKLIPNTLVLMPGGGFVSIPAADNDIVWRDIGAALYVKPTYLGNGKIDLEIYPVVSYLVDDPTAPTGRVRRGSNRRGPRQTVRVADITTHIVVMDGQRVSIGGVVGSKKNFYMNLFGPDFLSRDGHNSVLDMYVTARALRPGQSGRRSYFPRTPRGDTSKIKQEPPRREDPRDLFRH